MRGILVGAVAGLLIGASAATAITLAVSDDAPEPNEVVIVREPATTISTRTVRRHIDGSKFGMADRTECVEVDQ